MIENLPSILYVFVTSIAIVGWLVLILFPRSAWSNFWFAGMIIPLVLSLIYAGALLIFWFNPPVASVSQFFKLSGVYAMFTNHGLLLVFWTNILTMDLVAGAWMARKAAQIRMPYLFLFPCLMLTFMFAGFGFALFSIVAAIGAGWGEIAKFEGQPPTNTVPTAARA
jgi:hypothetical protein